MFRVVTDQLKVSQGWVRCGHCAEVFDASKHLMPREASAEPSFIVAKPTADLDISPLGADALPAASKSGLVVMDGNLTLKAAGAESVFETTEAAGLPAERAWSFPRWGSGKRAQAHTAPAALSDAVDSATDFDPAGWKEALQKRQLQEDGAASVFLAIGEGKNLTHTPSDFVGLAEEAPVTDEPPRRPDLVRKPTVSDVEFEEELDDLLEPDVGAEKEISFVRDAVRRDFWKRPLVRGMLCGFLLVLAMLLGLQWVLQHKNSLAASEPQFRSALQALCGVFGCQVQPPRHVESLVIDSSTFNKIAPDAYRLSFVLKNTGSVPLEMPALELTLTDTQDQAVVRRVLLPAQFGVNAGLLAARGEVAGLVSLRVSGNGARPNTSASANASLSSVSPANSLPVAGYRVLVFYP